MDKRVNSITDEVIEVIENSDKALYSIGRESGVGVSTIWNWLNNNRSPTVENAQWVLKVCGYRLKIEKDGEVENVND